MGSNITMRMSDGFELDCYLATPSAPPKGAIVVVQEIFGVNSHIRSVADTYAENGYLAVAPALFDRLQKGVELGYTPEDIEVGRDLARGRTDFGRAVADVGDVATSIRTKLGAGGSKVGCVGYCWGGVVVAGAAFEATPAVDASVSYYGTGTVNFADRQPNAPIMFHFGDQDHTIPNEDVAKMQAAWPTAPVHVYHSQHGFNCDQRGSFDQASRDLALTRTFGFFATHIG
jgi:carboxymethylenebutenolidase